MDVHVTPLWVTTDLYWHGLTLQRIVLAPLHSDFRYIKREEMRIFPLPLLICFY